MLSIPHDAIEQCREVFGFPPKDLQLQVVGHIGRGEDCILIARCGWGKTLVYFLPLVFWNNCIIVVISPLKVLMHEQLKKLQAVGISSISLDGDMVFHSDLVEQLASGRYRAVFMTPEFIFCKNSRVMDLWTMDGWQSRLQAVVIDEAHCVSTWGTTFRESYIRLGELRAKVRPGVAFVAVSATLPNGILEDLKRILYFRTHHLINTGNDRPNIRLEVRQLPRYHLGGLNFLKDLEKSIVYLETRARTVEAYDYLRTVIHPSDWGKISSYHALLDSDSKDEIMEKFKQGDIRLLLATEAAGLGCDIPDISRVVQFNCPKDLPTLVQRLGRAARNLQIEGVGILLVPRPFLTAKCSDPDLVRYITSKECRRKVLNEVFENDNVLVEDCCDICHPIQEPLPVNTFLDVTAEFTTMAPERSPEQKAAARTKIQEWRSAVFLREYRPRCDYFTEDLVLPDDAVEQLVEAIETVSTAESIQSITSWTFLREELADDLARTLRQFNEEIEQQSRLREGNDVVNRTSSREDQVVQATRNVSKRQLEFIHTTVMDFSDRNNKRGRM